MNEVTKPKRKFSDISFEQDGAHIALTSKTLNGGPANGADYALVLKANKFSEEFIEKVQQVKVTMELPDFLQKFFYLWEDDADVLAYMMGYVEPVETQQIEADEATQEFQDWVSSRMTSLEILKGAYEAASLSEYLSKLDEDQYLAMLKDQEKVEKAFKKQERLEKSKGKKPKGSPTESVTKVTDASTPVENTKVEVEKTSVTKPNTENPMTKEVKTVEVDKTVEMVEKAEFEAIKKALDKQKEELQKAQEQVANFQKAEKERIAKQRKEQIEKSVGNKEDAEALAKALLLVEDEAEFQIVVKALANITSAAKKIQDENLFVEKGASGEVKEPTKDNPLEAMLKAKFHTK